MNDEKTITGIITELNFIIFTYTQFIISRDLGNDFKEFQNEKEMMYEKFNEIMEN